MSSSSPSATESHVPALTGKQRRYLRGLAHHLEPVVQIGKEGASQAVQHAVARTLDDHELIKIRVLESAPEGRHELGEQLASALRAHLVGTVGRILMLYRPRRDEPSIVLPSGVARR